MNLRASCEWIYLPLQFKANVNGRYVQENVGSACCQLVNVFTVRVSREAKAIGSVRPSVRLSVRSFPLYILNRLTFEMEFFSVCGS